MIAHFCESWLRNEDIRKQPEGRLLERYADEICLAGYAEETARGHIRAGEHLIYWADREGTPIRAFDQPLVEKFARHIERCRCPGFEHMRRRSLPHAARLFLDYLRRSGVLTAAHIEPVTHDPILVVSFCEWMRQQRGTCDDTVKNYCLDLRELLKKLGEDPAKFDARNLRKFVLERSQRHGWSPAKRCTTAVRMFVRFLIAEGKCSAGLDAAIPTWAHWRCSSLPRYLQSDEVERVIASCAPNTHVGVRDRAILLLLARLALRAGDIIQLRLGDIDWKEAWICVCGKGRRQTRLPMTQEVGDALASYISQARHPSDTDALFIRSRAPMRPFQNQNAVSAIVGRAMRRAGVSSPSRGAAHVLRHSAATSMLRHGASLQEIGVILRHRSIAATEIYAKVDFAALQQIAQPWPEVTTC